MPALVSVSSYTGQKYCQHINSVLYESLFQLSTIKSCHFQGFRWLMKVWLTMALEDNCEARTQHVSSFKHFYINIYKKMRRISYFTKIKVSKIYSVFSDIHSHHTLRGMLAVQHILHCIYTKIYSEDFSDVVIMMCTDTPLHTVHE